MGNVEEEKYEYGKCWGIIVCVWEILRKNFMSMGNLVKE